MVLPKGADISKVSVLGWGGGCPSGGRVLLSYPSADAPELSVLKCAPVCNVKQESSTLQ